MTTEPLSPSLEETLAVFTAGGQPWTTPEVAEQLDVGRRTVYTRLELLADRSLLETKKVGAGGRVWWRPQAVGTTDTFVETNGSDRGAEPYSIREEFKRLVEATEEYAVCTLDADGYVQTWNPGVERIEGYEADEVLGEHFSTFYTEDARENGVPAETLSKAAEHGIVEDEGWHVREDGSQFWASVTITAIRDDDGAVDGYTAVIRDMSDRPSLGGELHHQREHIQRIIETVPVGVVIVEPSGTFEVVNDQAAALLELDQATPETKTVGVNAVYDEDGDHIPPEERPYVRVFETGESIRDWHAQVERADGSRRWLSTNIEPVTDDDGTVERAVVTVQDISQLKAQAERLERQRDDLKSELDEVFDRITDGFYALDEELRFTYINDIAAETLGVDESAIGRHIFDEVSTAEPFERALSEAQKTQEPVTFEDYYEQTDRWLSITLYPSESGLSVYFRDISERKEREQELQRSKHRFEAMFNDPNILVGLLDTDGTVRDINDTALEYTDARFEDIEGEPFWETPWFAEDESLQEEIREWIDRAAAGEYVESEIDLTKSLDEETIVDGVFRPVTDDDGEITSILISDRDVTDRKRYERDLEQIRDFFAEAEHLGNLGAWEFSETGDTVWTEGTRRIHEVDEEFDPSIEAGIEFFHPDDRDRIERAVQESLEDGNRYDVEGRIVTAKGNVRWVRARGKPVVTEDGKRKVRGFIQDITERVERERTLRETKAQIEAATRAGEIGTWNWDVQEDRVVAGAWFADIFGVDPEVASEGAPLDTFLSQIHENDRGQVEAAIKDALSRCGDYEIEYRVRDADDEIRWVVARGQAECADGEPVAFPGALVDITERKRAELELEQQRGQLAALNNLNSIVQKITDAVISQSTREEIEQTVCSELAAADVYEFAWFGDVDATSQTVDLRTEAGVEGYLDGITISVDPDSERSQGPTGRAFRTGEIQTTQNINTDPRHEPWRDHLDNYGIQSSAAIPVVYEGTTYGVLNVYTARPNAFQGREREVISRLGEVIGHAIAAADRKRALMSDDVVELEFQIPDVFAMLGLSDTTADRITIDHAVPRGGDQYLVYGTTTADGIDVVNELADVVPHWESVRVRSNDEEVNFDVRMTDPPVLSEVGDLGGYLEQFVIEDGDCRLVIHLAPSVDVRRVLDTVTDSYPQAEMLRRTQISRPETNTGEIPQPFIAELTERQRAALDAAYHSGYFAWPRETDGNQVAESLGIAPSTFSHHLRLAQQKVFDRLYSSPTHAIQ